MGFTSDSRFESEREVQAKASGLSLNKQGENCANIFTKKVRHHLQATHRAGQTNVYSNTLQCTNLLVVHSLLPWANLVVTYMHCPRYRYKHLTGLFIFHLVLVFCPIKDHP